MKITKWQFFLIFIHTSLIMFLSFYLIGTDHFFKNIFPLFVLYLLYSSMNIFLFFVLKNNQYNFYKNKDLFDFLKNVDIDKISVRYIRLFFFKKGILQGLFIKITTTKEQLHLSYYPVFTIFESDEKTIKKTKKIILEKVEQNPKMRLKLATKRYRVEFEDETLNWYYL